MLLVHDFDYHSHLGVRGRLIASLVESDLNHGRTFFGWDPRLKHETESSRVGLGCVEPCKFAVDIKLYPQPVSFGLDLRGDLVLQEGRNCLRGHRIEDTNAGIVPG